MKGKIILPFLFLCLLVAGTAFAQSDICCVTGKTSGEGAETMATVRAPEDCKIGTGGYKICAAKADPNNECSMLGEKERCSICRFFWNGKNCLAEDPVKKAKEQLKKEEEAKKKKEAASKAAAPTE